LKQALLAGVRRGIKSSLWICKIVLPISFVIALVQWLAACVFGLAYGGAVIVEEAKKGDLTQDELNRLHISIGTNHSMIEDPLLFMAIGLNGLWLWIPRFLMAVVAVRAYDGLKFLKNRLVRAE
jgi:hypothetical protein